KGMRRSWNSAKMGHADIAFLAMLKERSTIPEAIDAGTKLNEALPRSLDVIALFTTWMSALPVILAGFGVAGIFALFGSQLDSLSVASIALRTMCVVLPIVLILIDPLRSLAYGILFFRARQAIGEEVA